MHDAGTTTLLRRLGAHVEAAPHRPALCLYTGERFGLWSYGDLQARAWRWGERWREAAGEGAEGRIALIVLPHGIDLYAAFLGAMAAGLVPSILPPPQVRQSRSAWAEAQAAVIARATPAALAAGVAEREALSQAAAGLPTLAPEAFRPAGPGFRPADPGPDAPALLQHSSGTTGLKKGVVLSFGQIDAHVAMLATRLGATGEDLVASWLPLYHDMGLVAAFLLPLSLGAGVVALDPFAWVADPMSWPRAIARHRATLAWAPNFAFAHLVRTRGGRPPVDMSSLRALIDCSEPCRPATVNAFTAAFADCGITPATMACAYGMAELVFTATQTPPGSPPRTLTFDTEGLEGPERRLRPPWPGARTTTLLSCGPPLEGVELAIDAAQGCAGEVLVKSPTRMSGYHEAEDADALPDGWRRTGDVGLIDGGELFVCGRLKEALIVAGRNLYAGDVEAVVANVAGARPGRAAALGLPDAEAGTEVLVILVETASLEAGEGLEARVREAVHGALAILPRHVVIAPAGALAKSTAGKVSRAENLALLQALLAEAEAEAAPPSPAPEDALNLVARALAECFGADAAQVLPATGPAHVTGWDSLGHTVLLLRLETLAGRRLAGAAAEARTAGELAHCLAPSDRRAA